MKKTHLDAVELALVDLSSASSFSFDAAMFSSALSKLKIAMSEATPSGDDALNFQLNKARVAIDRCPKLRPKEKHIASVRKEVSSWKILYSKILTIAQN